MLISLCTPVMNRLDDFKETMPYRIDAAKSSPPVELVVLDYNSTDGLNVYMRDLMDIHPALYITYRKYTKRNTYHAAHANNLVMLMGSGEWLVLVPADVYLEEGYMEALREQISLGAVWCNTARKRRSTIAFQRKEFIASGGYDERMEMYGPDDLDIIKRFERRGCKHGVIPDELIRDIYTSPEKKVANYRIKGLTHQELGKLSLPYYHENEAAGQLVANPGVLWGKWK